MFKVKISTFLKEKRFPIYLKLEWLLAKICLWKMMKTGCYDSLIWKIHFLHSIARRKTSKWSIAYLLIWYKSVSYPKQGLLINLPLKNSRWWSLLRLEFRSTGVNHSQNSKWYGEEKWAISRIYHSNNRLFQVVQSQAGRCSQASCWHNDKLVSCWGVQKEKRTCRIWSL